MDIGYLEYDVESAATYSQPGAIATQCIDILIQNTGTVIAYVNNWPIQPNDTLPVTGNIGEIIKRQLNLKFAPIVVVSDIQEVTVLRRVYINTNN